MGSNFSFLLCCVPRVRQKEMPCGALTLLLSAKVCQNFESMRTLWTGETPVAIELALNVELCLARS